MNYTELPCLWVKNKYLNFFSAHSFDLRVQKPFNFLVELGIGEVYLNWNGNKGFLAFNHSASTNSDTVVSIMAF